MLPLITDMRIVTGVAVGMAVAGIILFALAPRAATMAPPALMRVVGLFAVLSGVWPLWACTESWVLPGVLFACSLAAMVVIHLRQTHGAVLTWLSTRIPQRTPPPARPTGPPRRFAFHARQPNEPTPPTEDISQPKA
jgi:hypothetical protein